MYDYGLCASAHISCRSIDDIEKLHALVQMKWIVLTQALEDKKCGKEEWEEKHWSEIEQEEEKKSMEATINDFVM